MYEQWSGKRDYRRGRRTSSWRLGATGPGWGCTSALIFLASRWTGKDTSIPSLWDDEEVSTTGCGGSSAVAVTVSCGCEVRDSFAENDGSAWDSGGGAIVSTIRREVSCVGSLLTLKDVVDTWVAVSGSDDETAGACSPLGLLPSVPHKCF